MLGGVPVVLDDDVVGHDDGGENGEAVLRVQRALVVVRVHPRQLDLVAGLAHVAQVAQQDRVLRAGQAAGRNLL